MNYGSWNDVELRRVLGVNPNDLAALMEAAHRFERVETSDIEALETQVADLKAELEDAQAEAQGWHDDYDSERSRAEELQRECDALQDRVTELESQGAGLL